MELFLLCPASRRLGLRGDSLSGVVIHVKFGHGVDPYFDFPMPGSMKG
jgi:hypothetical protein